MARKNPAAVALGRKGGLKGGPARASRLTPQQRSESARNAVLARWGKSKPAGTSSDVTPEMDSSGHPERSANTSDKELSRLLKRLKATVDPHEIRDLSDQIERIVFHKQFTNA